MENHKLMKENYIRIYVLRITEMSLNMFHRDNFGKV